MDLKDKRCLPCEGYVPPLSQSEKQNLLKNLNPEWKLTENDTRLRREFKFKSFKRPLEFTNLVGAIAEAEKHHPEISLGWGHCEIEVWTHTNNNLVENDFILAAKIDEAFETLPKPKSSSGAP